MKISEIPTEHIMVNAKTNSEWDWCDFAIIHISQEWKKEQRKRLDNIKPFSDDYLLLSMMYYDESITFFKDDSEICPDSAELLDERQWAYIEIDENTIEKLSVPENRISAHSLHVFKSNCVIYQAFGKHTGEEFWTDLLPMEEFIQ